MPLASLGPACTWRSGPSLSSPVLSSRTAGQGRDPEAKPPSPALRRPPSRRGPFCLYLAQGSPWALPSSPLGPSASRSAGRGWAWKLLLSRDIWEDSTMFHRLVSSSPDQRSERRARWHFAGEKPGLIRVARPAGGREASEPASGLAPRGRRRWARVSRKLKPFWAPWHLAPS